MAGALLDTHALYWLVSGVEDLSNEALVAIGESQAGTLLVSPISAWELSVAAQKKPERRPDLGDLTPRAWFREAVRLTGARLAPIQTRIALEAAEVAKVYARKDPGDCFLIATARVRGVPIITRDRAICDLARDRPEYLTAIAC